MAASISGRLLGAQDNIYAGYQSISAINEVEEIMQTEDASTKDMTAVSSIDCSEMKQIINSTVEQRIPL